MRPIALGLAATTAVSVAHSGDAAANPAMECQITAEQPAGLHDCLRAQLDVSYRALEEALALARGAAVELDRATGGEAAVLAIEASQHAWEAYRDTECRTQAIVAAANLGAAIGSGDRSFELACEIELTRERIDALLRLAYQRRS